jgi:CheY-like chemotaxis protein
MESLGFHVLTAPSGPAGVKLFLLNHVDLVITDYEMPELKGDAVARMVKAIDPKVPVIMFSGSTVLGAESRRWIDAFCDKAGSRAQLMNSIYRLLARKHSRTLQPAPLVAASQGERQRTVA